MSSQERLSKYVCRILKKKRLSLSDVERMAGGEISDSYICAIVKGRIGDLTVGKLMALARGLGVAEEEIIDVVRGAARNAGNGFQQSEFAMLFNKYKELSDEDKREMLVLLDVIDREIERRRAYRKSSFNREEYESREDHL